MSGQQATIEQWITANISDDVIDPDVKRVYIETFKAKRVKTMRQLAILVKNESTLLDLGVEEIHVPDILECIQNFKLLSLGKVDAVGPSQGVRVFFIYIFFILRVISLYRCRPQRKLGCVGWLNL